MANSSRLVLPTMHRPGVGEALDDGGVVRRPPRVEDPRRARGGHAPGAHVVLHRDRHTGERARVSPGGHGGVDARRPGPGPRRRMTWLKAWTSASRSSMRARCSSRTSGGASPPPAAAMPAAVRLARRRSRRLAQHGRDAEHPAPRPTAPRPGPRPGRGRGGPRRTAPRSAAGTGARWAGRRRGRAHSTSGRGRGSMASCPVNRVELVVGERQPGEAGDLGHVVALCRSGRGREPLRPPGRTIREVLAAAAEQGSARSPKRQAPGPVPPPLPEPTCETKSRPCAR